MGEKSKKMRLVFLYTSIGANPVGSNSPWNPAQKTENFYATNINGLLSEGYLYMLKKMLEEKIVDDLIIFIESSKSPGSTMIEGIKCYVTPQIEYIEDYLKEDDIIFARGGFRTWFPFLNKMKEQKRWLLLYAANTGRQRWKFWDIVFDDLNGKFDYDIHKRFWFDFKKPIHEKIFFPMKTERIYDLCLGASHIHEKKGQWKTIEAIIKYKEIFGKSLRCIMPGRGNRGVNTTKIKQKVSDYHLDVAFPGMVTRDEVCKIMNQSKLFVYLGGGGQNDRGPLEALRCGTPIMITNPPNHSPVVYSNPQVCETVRDSDNFELVATKIRGCLENSSEGKREYTTSYFQSSCGLNEVIIPDMRKLFNIIRANPVPDIEPLKKEYL